MVIGKIWIKNEQKDTRQSGFGETVSILITDADNPDEILFKAGPYTIPKGESISHELLTGSFCFNKSASSSLT